MASGAKLTCEFVNVHMRKTNVETLRLGPDTVILWRNCEPAHLFVLLLHA